MEAMNYWINDLSSKSPATRQKYQTFFEMFLDYANKTPNELIEQRRKDLKADDPREAKNCENLLKGFITKIKDEKKYKPGTLQIAFAAIKSFFESNEYPLRMKKADYPKGESIGQRVITKQIIRQMLEDTKRMKDKKKMKALIMFLKDTGLGVSDVGNLTYGDIRKDLESNVDFIPLQLLRQKTHTIVKTFIGPEAVKALKEYFEERQAGTRRIPPEILTNNSPLFRTNRGEEVKRISRGGLSSMMRFQCLKTGEVKLSAHSFRKYVQTNLEVAGVNTNWIDRILGHKPIGSRDPYSQPTEEQLLEAYKNAYSTLKIYPDKVDFEEKLSNLEREITERNNMIANRDADNDKLREEIADLRKMVEPLVAIAELVNKHGVIKLAVPNQEEKERLNQQADEFKNKETHKKT